MAALSAADAGAQKVLLVDSAPEGEEGGNSRFCAQIVVYGQNEAELRSYYDALGWHMDQDSDVLDAYVAGIMGVPDIFKRMGIEDPCIWSEFAATAEGEAGQGGNDETDAQKIKRSFASICPEYPELEGATTVDAVTMHPAYFDGAFYPVVQENVQANDAITVWLESPATHLIQDGSTGTVTGVIIEHEGAELRIGASGVVLACGGFECNKQMIQDYLGCPRLAPLGGIHNFGDGIRMAQEVGADLWHMHNYESLGMLGGNQYKVEEGERAILMLAARYKPSVKGAYICVAEDGSRFLREDQTDRHGHLYSHGIWKIPTRAIAPGPCSTSSRRPYSKKTATCPSTLTRSLCLPPTPQISQARSVLTQESSVARSSASTAMPQTARTSSSTAIPRACARLRGRCTPCLCSPQF